MTGGAFLEFHGDADRTLFKDRIMLLKAGNTVNMLVELYR
jgi:hypothetical protein